MLLHASFLLVFTGGPIGPGHPYTKTRCANMYWCAYEGLLVGGTPGRTRREGSYLGDRTFIWEDIQIIVFAKRPHHWYSGVFKGAGGSRPPLTRRNAAHPTATRETDPNAHWGVPFSHTPHRDPGRRGGSLQKVRPFRFDMERGAAALYAPQED